MARYKLEAQNAPVKSFYGKAEIDSDPSNAFVGNTRLFSYDTEVAVYGAISIPEGEGVGVILNQEWDYSQTTLRHVREFICQTLNYTWNEASTKNIRKNAIKVDDEHIFLPAIIGWYPAEDDE